MKSRAPMTWSAALALIVAPLGAVALTMSPASAATVTVCASGCDHTTVKDAVAAALPNDVIEIGAGTFNGEQGIVIDKPLTIVGQGVGDTIIDGGGASAGSVPGIFRILPGTAANGTGDIEISDLTLRNPGKNTTASQYFTISIGVKQATTGIGAIDLHDLDVRGTGDVAKTGYGIYADTGAPINGVNRQAPTLTVSDSTFSDHVYQAVGVDAWTSAVTIEGNDLREGLNGNSALLVFNEYVPDRITAPVVIRDNTSVGRLIAMRNIDFNATLDSRGGFDDVEVTGNTVTGLAGSDYAGLFSSNSSTNTEPTWFGSVDITDNVVTGDGVSTGTAGFVIGGVVEDATITDNDITRVGGGVSVTTVKDQIPDSVVLRHNRLFANQHGVRNDTGLTVDAAENWWGCVRDPLTATDECSGVDNSGSGSVTTAPWIVPTATASDDEVETGGTLDVDVRLDTLSDGGTVVLPGLFAGLDTMWSADEGVVDPAEGELDGAFSHAAVYTAPEAAGPDVITVAVDRVGPTGIQTAAFGEPTIIGEPVTIELTVLAVDGGGDGDGDGDGDGGSGGGDQASGGAELPGAGAPPVGGVLLTAVLALLVGTRLVMGPKVRGRHL